MIKLFDDIAEQASASGPDVPAQRRLLAALAAAVLVLASGFGFLAFTDHVRLGEQRRTEEDAAGAKLSMLQNRLETALDQRLFLGQGLETIVRRHQDVAPKDFETYARILLAGRSGVRRLILAPGSRVTHVYPREGANALIGQNLPSRADLAAPIREAVSRRTLVLAGPFALIQGGRAFSALTPVFLSNEGERTDYWGLVAVDIEADAVFDEAGFRTASERMGIRVAVRGRDGGGESGEMVWGDPQLFNEHPVLSVMSVPGGRWQLAVVPLAGWTDSYPDRLHRWGLGLGLTLLAAFLATFLVLAAYRVRFQFEGREAVKRELTESEERFRRLAEAAWEGLVIHDWAHIYDFNMRLVEMTGHAPEELRRMSLLDLIEPEDRPRINPRTGTAQSDIRMRCKGGRSLVVEARGADLFFRGRVLHVTSLRDITQTKEAEAALVAARDSAQMANRVKSEFLANMSHELRTPLNAILGFAEIMKQELLGPLGAPRYKAYSRDIQISAQHLLDIINDILDISRLEAGTMDLYESLFNPAQIAKACLRLLEARAAKNKCALVLDLPEDPLPLLCADERRMKQILLNLLSNAVKFTPEGGEVRLKLRHEAGQGLLFAVSDTGIGMSEEDIRKALTPFLQVDSGMNRKQEGTGLGLPLAKSMIEMHGARMLVESRPGEGTTVSFCLPPERVQADAKGLPPRVVSQKK